jgi:hypothetical protein
MTNLGNVDEGDGVRFETQVTNISSVVADATDIGISILDNSDVILINKSTMTKSTTGTYRVDIFLDPAVFGAGLHRAIFSGYITNISENTSFYDSNTFYIEENRLV